MADIKQYINLDPTRPLQLNGRQAARAGRTIKLEATVAPVRENSRVTFTVTNGPTNVRNPNGVSRSTVRTNAQGIAKYELKVSKYGGDSFTVTATGTKRGEQLSSDRYIVWRLFYYQLSRVDAVAKGANRDGGNLPAVAALDLGPVEDVFANHHIELVADNRQDLIPRPCNVFDRGLDFPPTGAQSYNAEREPVGVRIVLVNQIAKSATAEITCTVPRDNEYYNLPHPTLWNDDTVPLNTDWLIGASFRKHGTTDAWTPVAPGRLKRTGPSSSLLELDFTDVPGDVASVDLKVNYRYRTSSTAGISLSNLIYIGAAADPARQQTLVHELGHFVGMVLAGQPRRYVEHGHKGPHCSTGLSAVDLGLANYGGRPGTCVMFGETNAARAMQFCADCAASIKNCSLKVTRELW